jgi:hypothetical protein
MFASKGRLDRVSLRECRSRLTSVFVETAMRWVIVWRIVSKSVNLLTLQDDIWNEYILVESLHCDSQVQGRIVECINTWKATPDDPNKNMQIELYLSEP